jgi:hypothetical protein
MKSLVKKKKSLKKNTKKTTDIVATQDAATSNIATDGTRDAEEDVIDIDILKIKQALLLIKMI